MLLIKSDVTNMRAVLSSTRGSKYQPSGSTCGSTAASNAVAPAGGCIVFVRVMAAEASPQANAPATHRRFSKLGLSVKSLATLIPITAERKCPIIILRGWASGDWMVLYSRIAAAPCLVSAIGLLFQSTERLTKLAITIGTPWSCIAGIIKTASMVMIPINAPKKAHPAISMLPISCLGLSRYPKNRAIGFGSLWMKFDGMNAFR